MDLSVGGGGAADDEDRGFRWDAWPAGQNRTGGGRDLRGRGGHGGWGWLRGWR